jgi:diketogulonate reductase-like aldo/keto reductase
LYKNEAGIGAAVRDVAGRVRREEIFVSACARTRLFCRILTRPGAATKIHSNDHGYESTLAGVDASLRAFGFGAPARFPPIAAGLMERADYIDLFLIHEPTSGKERRLATYRALLVARDAGKVRSVGVSN